MELYLKELSQRLEVFAPGFAPSPEELLTLDELVHQDFERIAADEIAAINDASERLAVVNDRIDVINALKWLRRWRKRTELAQLHALHAELEEALHLARTRFTLAERKHLADHASFLRIHQHYEELGRHTARREAFEHLQSAVESIQHQILQAQLVYGRSNVNLKLTGSAPSLRDPQDIAPIQAFVDGLAQALPGTLEREAVNLSGEHDAQEILDALRALPSTMQHPNPKRDQVSAATLRALLSIAQWDQPEAYDDLMRVAVRPSLFRQLEAWLLFWTCEAARHDVLVALSADSTSLDNAVDTWCRAWPSRSARWSPGTQHRFAASNTSLPCKHFRLHGPDQAPASCDVLVILNVSSHHRSYCSVAGVHFVDDSPASPASADASAEQRFPSTTAALPTKRKERWRGLMAVRCPAPTASFDFDVFTYNHTAATCTSSTRLPASRFGTDADSLATSLAANLTAQHGSAFPSLGDALRWIDDTVGLPLPQHVIVLSLGRGEEAMSETATWLAQRAVRCGSRYEDASIVACPAPDQAGPRDGGISHAAHLDPHHANDSSAP